MWEEDTSNHDEERNNAPNQAIDNQSDEQDNDHENENLRSVADALMAVRATKMFFNIPYKYYEALNYTGLFAGLFFLASLSLLAFVPAFTAITGLFWSTVMFAGLTAMTIVAVFIAKIILNKEKSTYWDRLTNQEVKQLHPEIDAISSKHEKNLSNIVSEIKSAVKSKNGKELYDYLNGMSPYESNMPLLLFIIAVDMEREDIQEIFDEAFYKLTDTEICRLLTETKYAQGSMKLNALQFVLLYAKESSLAIFFYKTMHKSYHGDDAILKLFEKDHSDFTLELFNTILDSLLNVVNEVTLDLATQYSSKASEKQDDDDDESKERQLPEAIMNLMRKLLKEAGFKDEITRLANYQSVQDCIILADKLFSISYLLGINPYELNGTASDAQMQRLIHVETAIARVIDDVKKFPTNNIETLLVKTVALSLGKDLKAAISDSAVMTHSRNTVESLDRTDRSLLEDDAAENRASSSNCHRFRNTT